jgi:CheY-like chemotaxis protein
LSASAVRRIFIADDDATIVQMLADFLEDEGYAVAGCTNSLHITERVRAFVPDLIVMNLHMPYLDGDEALALLDQEGLLEGVPVILTCAKSSPFRHSPASLHIVDCLYKPFEIVDFLKSIERALSARERP